MSENREIIETRGDYRAVLVADPEPMYANPRDHDNLGNLAIVGLTRYSLGDDATDETERVAAAMERTRNWRVVARWLRAFHGATVVLKVGVHIHSGITCYVGGGAALGDAQGWDSGTAGLIFDTPQGRANLHPDATPEQIEQYLTGEVETYAAYLEGEVYGAVVEQRTTRAATLAEVRDAAEALGDAATFAEAAAYAEHLLVGDEDAQVWDEVDACWGYVGREHAEQSARDTLDGYAPATEEVVPV